MKKIKISKMIIVVLMVFLITLLGGCFQTKEEIAAKEKKAHDREIMSKRYVEIGNYVEAYLEKKYQEDFQNGGIYETSGTTLWNGSNATVTFNFRSNYTGVYFRPVYTGEYAHPDFEADIESGKVGDQSYHSWRKGFEFGKHEKAKIDELFPGVKTKYYSVFGLDKAHEELYYEDTELIEPKYFDIDYILENEKDNLRNYYLNIDYFRDVYPENKEEMLEDIYAYLMYTRSLGFKRCNLDMSIFEKSILESEEYKTYVEDDISGELYLHIAGHDMRYIAVWIDYDDFEAIQTFEDLKKMVIFHEHVENGFNQW